MVCKHLNNNLPRRLCSSKMSSELLLELPGKVEKVFSLTQAPGSTFLKSALVIVQSDSVSVIHVRTDRICAKQSINFKFLVVGL